MVKKPSKIKKDELSVSSLHDAAEAPGVRSDWIILSGFIIEPIGPRDVDVDAGDGGAKVRRFRRDDVDWEDVRKL